METQWSERLAEMEGWYRNLLRKGSDEAEHALSADYRPHAEYLGELRGRILDVGGGSGLTARYLDSSCEYYVIDPATIWGEPEWREFGSGFRDVGPKVHFLKGMGEELPLK